MKKTFKKIAASVMAVATLTMSAAGMSANAGSASVIIDITSRGGNAWNTSADAKDDNEQTAYYNITTGTVSSTSYLYFQLYSSKSTTSTALTSAKKITGKGSYTSAYNVYRAANTISYLHANAGYYGASAGGNYYA